MAYQKHIWVSKEIIRREYLQNIEDGIYNEEQRAMAAEDTLTTNLSNEAGRATRAEQAIRDSIATLRDDLDDEVDKTDDLENDLVAEVTRALSAEGTLSDNIDTVVNDLANEQTRALNAESALNTKFNDYVAKTDIATASDLGISKPDDVTIKVDANGVYSIVETNFTGTLAQWNALTQDEKDQYKTVDIRRSTNRRGMV